MNKLFKRLLLVVVVLSFLVFFGYQYALTLGSRDFKTESSSFKVVSSVWKKEFISNVDSATQKYLNKAVEVTGKVASVDEGVVNLDDGVSCQFVSVGAIKKGDLITIKGRVTGYDDLLEEIKMDQCLVPVN